MTTERLGLGVRSLTPLLTPMRMEWGGLGNIRRTPTRDFLEQREEAASSRRLSGGFVVSRFAVQARTEITSCSSRGRATA